jgi:ABC-type nitrate/sulfonate/bicarbonate transport system permease component
VAETKDKAPPKKEPPPPAAKADAAPSIPRPPRWLTTLRAEPPAVLGKLLGLACILLVLIIWYLFTHGSDAASRPISPSKLPSPGDVFDSYGKLEDRGLVDGIIATMVRVLKGFGWAAIVGIALGVMAASFRALAAFLNPLVLFGRSLPLAALIPITILWFGIGEKQKEMFIFLASVPFIFSDTVKAISLVPERYVETAQTLGASRWQIIYKVLFPLALPDIITGLRFLFGLALGYIMLAEAINSRAGLGFMINTGERLGLIEQNYLLLIIIGILAYLVDWVLRYMQRYFFFYRKDL